MSHPHASIKLVVGLGNPGSQYVYTWHNLGFLVLDHLMSTQRDMWHTKADFQTKEISYNTQNIHLLKPLRYMNLSGEVLGPFAQKKGILGTHTVVVHDEVDLPVGTVRLKWGGGSGGHRGLENIIAHWGRDFYRLRVGVGKDAILSTADHVLRKQPRSVIEPLALKA